MDKINFSEFSLLVEKNLMDILGDPNMSVVRVRNDNDILWTTYIEAYPAEVNGVFRERRNYDCNCCKNFIRRAASIVGLKDNKMHTIWEGKFPGYYQGVADKLDALVRSLPIENQYKTSERIAGSLQTNDNYDASIKWDHFYTKIPNAFILNNDSIGTHLSSVTADHGVLKRSMEEILVESAEVVLDLISQNSLYRGAEYKGQVELFIRTHNEYTNAENKEIFLWEKAIKLKGNGRFKNTAIGKLLVDLSAGEDLDKAVSSFETIVAPANYKRTSALVTPAMIENAKQKIVELGYLESLDRRFATINDIPTDKVLFTAVKDLATDAFAELTEDANATVDPKKLKKVEEISIDKFINDVLPRSKSVELLFDSRLKSNMMSLVAPKHSSAKSMLKWDNNLSWAYNGDVTDTITERVKKFGGSVEGDLRVSLSWFNADDLDLSCKLPNGKTIYYSNKHNGGGTLDLDMNGLDKSSETEPVENIIFKDKRAMLKGDYTFSVNQYNKRRNSDVGFSVQIAYDGQLQTFNYNKAFNSNVKVFVINWDGENFTVKNVWSDFTSTDSAAGPSEEVWDIKTGTFVPVKFIMDSPNHWDTSIGNKHTFFIIDGCKNNESVRGFFNEFLSQELSEHRKVLEVLGAKTKALPTNDQLSGFGFSETLRNKFTVRVKGSTNRILNVLV